jgi:hypothetical protein
MGARLLFLGALNYSDDYGIIRFDPRLLRSQVFPYDDLKLEQIKGLMDELVGMGFFSPYIYNQESFARIRSFEKHQRITRPSKWRFPEQLPDTYDPSPSPHGAITEPSVNNPSSKSKSKSKSKRIKEEELCVNECSVKLVQIWNNNCGSLPKVITISTKRKSHAEARWKSKPSETFWLDLAKFLAGSSWHNGQNDTGWKASFDFFTNTETFIKFEEGRLAGQSRPIHANSRTAHNLRVVDNVMKMYGETEGE